MIFYRKFHVKPNQVGYLYRKNKFSESLDPGIYKYFDFKRELEIFNVPITRKLITITNQELLTKDNIAFRFSYYINYRIFDGRLFLSNFELNKNIYGIIAEAENRIHNLSQIHIRNKISSLNSEEINEKRSEFTDLKSAELVEEFTEYGIKIENVLLKDITFPKSIQNLFSKQLEAKIRAKADLENARTAVATARALKNASELMKDDENIKYFQFLETITKIADKGKHTFMIGEFYNKPTENNNINTKNRLKKR